MKVVASASARVLQYLPNDGRHSRHHSANSRYSDCDRRWKLIEYVVGNEHHTQLFDLSTDPDELVNLAEKNGNAEILSQLRQELQRQAKSFDDPDAAVFSAAMESAAK